MLYCSIYFKLLQEHTVELFLKSIVEDETILENISSLTVNCYHDSNIINYSSLFIIHSICTAKKT